MTLFQNFQTDRAKPLRYRSKSSDSPGRNAILNYCSFEHFVYNLFFHTREGFLADFSLPSVFVRKRIMFVNPNPNSNSARSEPTTPLSVPDSISDAFKQLRDFITHIKQFNNTSMTHFGIRDSLRGKLKVIILGGHFSPKKQKKSAAPEISGSMFKKFVETRVLAKEIESSNAPKPNRNDVYRKKVLIRKKRNEQSIVYSQHTELSSSIQFNIARTSQYKINTPRFSRSKPCDRSRYSSNDTDLDLFSPHEGNDFLAQAYQTEELCVSKRGWRFQTRKSATRISFL